MTARLWPLWLALVVAAALVDVVATVLEERGLIWIALGINVTALAGAAVSYVDQKRRTR